MRILLIALAVALAILTASAVFGAEPNPPKIPTATAVENTVEARALNQFTKEYQQAFDNFTLEQFEAAKRGTQVKWMGKVTSVLRTGNHFIFKPVLSSAKDADFYVFVRAELLSGKSITSLVQTGQLVIVDGFVSSVSEGSTIVIAKTVCVTAKPKPEAE